LNDTLEKGVGRHHTSKLERKCMTKSEPGKHLRSVETQIML